MKHLHLITGLLICASLAGCGDYGDDGAVNSTGDETAEAGSTQFNLAVALPEFDGAGASKPRLRGERAVARAVTGTSAYTALQAGDVRAFVVVPDNGNAAGYREVSIDVAKFENLGNGRYRIAIDGQAQVDGFFAISINGVVFKVPLTRTGTTDEPIDVNALQSALADRLQALLVARDVCSAVSVAQLNTIFDSGRTYIDTLTVPDEIHDVSALIEFYRVAVSAFMQESIATLCAPALDNVAVTALAGDYHSLSSGLTAFYEVANVPVLQAHSTLIGSKTLQLSDVAAGQAPRGTFGGTISLDNRFSATLRDGASATFEDLTTTEPRDAAVSYDVSFASFANDAARAVVKNAEAVTVGVLDGTPFVPGLLVTRTPAWTQYAHDGSLFGVSQQNLRVFDLTSASASCLAAVNLTADSLRDREAFSEAASAVIDARGAKVIADALVANCGAGDVVGYGVDLRVDARRTAEFGVADMTGRFAVVSMEPGLIAGAQANNTGISTLSSDEVVDIDASGILTTAPAAGGVTQFAISSSLLAGGTSRLGGRQQQNIGEDDDLRIDVPRDGAQNPVSNGQLSLQLSGGENETYSGFASASRDLFAFGVPSIETVSAPGTGTGGLFIAAQLGVNGDYLATAGNFVYAAAYGSGMRIVDISNPARPVAAGLYVPANQASPQGIAVSGNYAYLALGEDGLDIVDITNKQVPTRAALLGSPAFSNLGLVQVSGTIVYGSETITVSGDSSSVLRVIDANVATAPQLIGSLDLSTLNVGANNPGEYVEQMAVAGNRLYVLSGAQQNFEYRLRVFDVAIASGTATLTPVGLYVFADDTNAIKVVGNRAYVTMGGDGMVILDVTNPAAITELGSVSAGYYYSTQLWVNGDIAYIIGSNEGPYHLQMVDISNPAAPQELGNLQLDTIYDIVGSGDYLFVGANSEFAGLLSINVASAPTPTQVAQQVTPFIVEDLTSSGAYLYASGNGFQIYNIADPEQPQALGSLPLSGTGTGIAVSGTRAFISDYSAGLVVADISNPQQPAALTGLSLGSAASDVAVAGSYAYVTDIDNGLYVVNVSGSTPALVQNVADATGGEAVAVAGNYAFVAGGNGLQAVDLTSLGNASVVGAVPNLDGRDIVILGSHAYVSDYDNQDVAIVDISDPTNMAVVGHAASWTYSDRLVLSGSTLYVVGEGEVSILDLTDPVNPLGIGRIDRDNAYYTGGAAVVGSYFFDSGTQQGENPAITMHSLLGNSVYTQASNGLAIGVRVAQTPPTAASLVGRQFTLTGQQAAKTVAGNSVSGGLGVIAGGNLRFVQVGGDVLPVFDLPLSSVIIADFTSLTPRLGVQFSQWTPSPVSIDANGRVTFQATDAVSGTTARFAAYLGNNGLLLGRFDALSPTPANTATDGVVQYPGLTRAAEGVFVGIPRSL